MCFESIPMDSESILMYFGRIQMCSESIPLHFASKRSYLKACKCFLKPYECNLKVYEYVWRTYQCIWNVYDHPYISSYNVKRKHKAAMAFHVIAYCQQSRYVRLGTYTDLFTLTKQISLPGCLYFLRYWRISVLQLFVYHVVMSKIMKLTLSF